MFGLMRDDGATWFAGGTYMVVRRIHMRIETWDQQTYSDQEEIIGRQKVSGAPMDGKAEFDKPQFAADSEGKVTATRFSHPLVKSAHRREFRA